PNDRPVRGQDRDDLPAPGAGSDRPSDRGPRGERAVVRAERLIAPAGPVARVVVGRADVPTIGTAVGGIGPLRPTSAASVGPGVPNASSSAADGVPSGPTATVPLRPPVELDTAIAAPEGHGDRISAALALTPVRDLGVPA